MLLGIAQIKAQQPSPIPVSRLAIDANVPIALTPGAVASDDAIWVRDDKTEAVVRIESKDNKVSSPMVAGAAPCASMVIAFSSVWVPVCGEQKVARISATELKVTVKADIAPAEPAGSIASGVGSIWLVTDRKGIVARVDPDTNQPVALVHVSTGAAAVLFHDDALWITSGAGKSLVRINPHYNEIVETITVGPEPMRLAALDDAVWTLNRGDGSVSRVDIKTNKVVATIAVGADVAAGEIAAGEGSIWISAPGVPLVRIDPRTNKIVQRFSGEGGGAVLVAHGSLWLRAGTQTWRLDPKLVAALRP